MFKIAIIGLLLASYIHAAANTYTNKTKKLFSICSSCNRPLRFYDNIPILSYILLHGRCRYCNEPIDSSSIIYELITPTLFILLYTSNKHLIYYLILLTLLYCCKTDLNDYTIPDRVHFILALLLLITPYKPSIFYALIYSLPLLFLSLLNKVGFGDAKLLFFLGLLLKETIILIMLIACISALCYTIIKRCKVVPLVPFILIGYNISIFF
ncbi:MAG: prepilin peptidase [Anaerorhabdus sp.]